MRTLGALLAFVLVSVTAPAGAQTVGAAIHVDAADARGPVNTQLLGTAQDPRSATGEGHIAALGVPHIRLHAYPEYIWPTQASWDNHTPAWSVLDTRLDAIARTGAVPLVVLSYMPAWLARTPMVVCDPSAASQCHRWRPPASLATWREVVKKVVRHAVERNPALRHFEVWNEPDWIAFWTGTLADYLELYEASVGGVQDAQAELIANGTVPAGTRLRVGGPGLLFADFAWIDALLVFARARGLPVDFVSFHWYADDPFIDPLPVTDNPLFLARNLADYTRAVRDHVTAAQQAGLAGDGDVWITEWNLHVGNSSPRDGTHYTAAFATAVVAHLADVGFGPGPHGRLVRANFFRTHDYVSGGTPTEGGLLSHLDARRPQYWAFQFLSQLTGTRVGVRVFPAPVTVGAYAARRADGTIAVVLYNFDNQAATGANVTLHLHDAPAGTASYLQRTIDATTPEAGPGSSTTAWTPGSSVHVHLAPRTVTQFVFGP